MFQPDVQTSEVFHIVVCGSLYWLPAVAHIQVNNLLLANRIANGAALSVLQPMVKSCTSLGDWASSLLAILFVLNEYSSHVPEDIHFLNVLVLSSQFLELA